MIGMSEKISGKLLATVAAASLVIMPVIVYADASAPSAVKAHKKKPMAHKRKHRAKAAQRAPAQPTEVAQAEPAPVYQAPPAPEPTPAPVAEPMPAPAPAPAPAPVMAEHHGSGALLGILGAAAVIGGIVAIAGGGGSSSP
jgi:acetyl esterase/lipase